MGLDQVTVPLGPLHPPSRVTVPACVAGVGEPATAGRTSFEKSAWDGAGHGAKAHRSMDASRSSPSGSALPWMPRIAHHGCRRLGTRGQGGYLRRRLHAGPEPHLPGPPGKTPGLQGGPAQKEVPPGGWPDLADPGTVSALEKLPADAGLGMKGPDELSGVTGIPEGRESEKVRQDFGVEGGPPEKSQ